MNAQPLQPYDPAGAVAQAMDAEGLRLLLRLPEIVFQPAVLVTVFRVEGSTPRSVGARMVVREGRLIAGTIGGGHLEQQAMADCGSFASGHAQALDAEDPRIGPAESRGDVREQANAQGEIAQLRRYPLGPQLAQCCGGVAWLHFRGLDRPAALQLAHATQQAQSHGHYLETSFGDEQLRERPQPLPTVLICGAGHVAAALSRVLQPLPWRVLVVDSRPEWAETFRFPSGTEVVCTEPLRLLAAWGWLGETARLSRAAVRLQEHGRPLPLVPVPSYTYALVMTHDHALDRDLTEALLRVGNGAASVGEPEGNLAYVGLIGSRSKIAATRQRLRRRGVDPHLLDRLVAPIGLQHEGRLLGGKLPGEIAISVAAQLLTLQAPTSTLRASE